MENGMEIANRNVSGRLASLDVFRGFDMFFIMGFSSLVIGICGVFGLGDGFWLVDQMKHPAWIGVTQHDTIFPTFIFIAGLSFQFSMAKQLAGGRTRWQIALRVLKHAVTPRTSFGVAGRALVQVLENS